jgi:hypothetical protein
VAAAFRGRFKEELAADPSLARFEKLASRLVFEHAPQELSASHQTAMKKFIAYRILDPNLKAPYMTIARARSELEKIEKQRADVTSDKWKEVKDTDIRKLKLYYTALEKEYGPYVVQPQQPVIQPTLAPKPPSLKPANDDASLQPVAKKPSANDGGPKA